jgi:hypothetical protein
VQQVREALRLWSRGEGLGSIAGSQVAGRLGPQIHKSPLGGSQSSRIYATQPPKGRGWGRHWPPSLCGTAVHKVPRRSYHPYTASCGTDILRSGAVSRRIARPTRAEGGTVD